jgi:hypothetical protein
VNPTAWAKRLRFIGEELVTLAGELETLGPNAASSPAVLTLAEFAAAARCCADTALHLCARGDVPGAWQRGKHGRWKIPRAGLDAWLANREDVVALESPRSPNGGPRRRGKIRDYLADLKEQQRSV